MHFTEQFFPIYLLDRNINSLASLNLLLIDTAKKKTKRVKSIIDFTTDFKSIVKSTHDLTGKSCAFDLRLIHCQVNCESIIDLTRCFTVCMNIDASINPWCRMQMSFSIIYDIVHYVILIGK